MEFFKDLFRKLNIERVHYTHGGAFVLGVFFTFGLVAIDGQMNSTEYRKSGAASVVRSMDEVKKEREEMRKEEAATTTEKNTEDSSELTEEEEGATEEPEIELIVEGPAPDPQEEEEAQIDDNLNSQAAAQQALEQAQQLLADLTEQQQEAQTESGEDAVYTTPSGVKIDANGNVIGEETITTIETSSNNDTTNSVTLPAGVYQLPNGQFVYADGSPYTGDTTNAVTYVQPSPTNDYVTLESGMVIDRLTGAIISLPPKKEEELIPATIIDPNNLPAQKSTINIPQEVKYNNDRELCNLYQNNKDDYVWETVKTE
jgi:type II secretory pathway pseudopilin PulG